ncbi:hypothetical protein SDC9_102008 [bioreactor metagenome]|uniref:Uncharacterized protein n=1 Tax=bioreactor metagenome TaxID=1076179 RepID=A0A645APN0_9ZZZZ
MLLFPEGLGRHGGLDQLHQLQSGFHGPVLPCADNGPGDGGSVPLLAVVIKNAPQLVLAPLVHHPAGGEVGGSVHPHVQRRVVHVGKAAGRVVQLRRRHAQIKQQSVRGGNAAAFQDLRKLGKIAPDQRHPVQPGSQPFLRGVNGGPIPVNADQPPGCQPLGNLF